MPLDQEYIAELLPDNTSEQISPQDLRDSFAEVANAYDGLSVTSIRAIITDDAGDGSVASDCAASNFAGAAEPDPAPDTFLTISDGSLVTLFHKGVAYFWAGPSGVTLGLGGGYVPELGEFQNAGVSDHGLLVGLADDDHTQYHNDARGDTRYQGQIDTLSQWDADHLLAADPHAQYHNDARGDTRYQGQLDDLSTNKLSQQDWINFAFVKGLQATLSGNGAANPTLTHSYNVASAVRQSAGVYRITATQGTFFGVSISDDISAASFDAVIPSTLNVHLVYSEEVTPGVLDVIVQELSPTGPQGSIVPVAYDLEAGDQLSAIVFIDLGDGTLPPA